MGITLEEQETVIQFNRTDAHATIYTSDSTIMTKLDKLCDSSPDYYKLTKTETVEGKVVTKFYRLEDKTRISFRSKKVERNLTEEQKEQFRERIKNTNFGRSVNSTTETEDETTF